MYAALIRGRKASVASVEVSRRSQTPRARTPETYRSVPALGGPYVLCSVLFRASPFKAGLSHQAYEKPPYHELGRERPLHGERLERAWSNDAMQR
jgi:hypothetical protein